jgi:hypothetical protein
MPVSLPAPLRRLRSHVRVFVEVNVTALLPFIIVFGRTRPGHPQTACLVSSCPTACTAVGVHGVRLAIVAG